MFQTLGTLLPFSAQHFSGTCTLTTLVLLISRADLTQNTAGKLKPPQGPSIVIKGMANQPIGFAFDDTAQPVRVETAHQPKYVRVGVYHVQCVVCSV